MKLVKKILNKKIALWIYLIVLVLILILGFRLKPVQNIENALSHNQQTETYSSIKKIEEVHEVVLLNLGIQKIKPIKNTFFNKETLSKFVIAFQDWFETAFNKRFSYQALDVEARETALTDINGDPKERIVQGVVGVIKDDFATVPDKFLYDTVVYDSPKEKESIARSNIDEVVVFGKIPRKSIQVPLYFGGTTSPDFMYVLKKDEELMFNFIVETKDIKKDSSLREEEKLRIQSAKKFFETLADNGINVSFEKQLQSDDIIAMIKGVLG